LYVKYIKKDYSALFTEHVTGKTVNRLARKHVQKMCVLTTGNRWGCCISCSSS